MIQEYIKCFLLVFVAEMGDKTQILALTFATKYSIKKVLVGVFIGSLLNHGIAVALGSSLSRFIDFRMMGIIAGILFIIFSIWTLKIEDDDEDKINYKYGAILTVAIAFFLGELGDKTQLTAITLASESIYPFIVLAGTVSAMVFTSAIGIFVGMKLGKSIPETTVKIISSIIFMMFGFSKLFETISKVYMNYINVSIVLIIILSLIIYRIRKLLLYDKLKITKLRQEAENIKMFYNSMQNRIENVCLGDEICGKCEGKSCIIGYIKYLINNEINNPGLISKDEIKIIKIKDKKYNIEMLMDCLVYVVSYLEKDNNNVTINAIRRNIEIILFNISFESYVDKENYLSNIESIIFDKKEVLLDKFKEKNEN